MYFSDKKSYKGYRWKINKVDENKVLAIYQKYNITEILARLITLKDIDFNEVESFLNPTLKGMLKDPNHMLDMEKGVNILYNSIINNEKIAIFGDYDVDGITSSALMKKFFDLIKVNSIVHIPNRLNDGYGPSVKAFEKLKFVDKVDLILTVDCGISAIEACDFAKKNNLKVVITDHHLEGEKLPNADAIIDPKRHSETTSYTILAGVGVAFLFVISLNRKLRENNYYKNENIPEPNCFNFLDLVALGTVCDVVPIVDINRVFVKQGLKLINKRQNIGISSLIDVINITDKINTYHIGFVLGPRINATGRINDANETSKLFYTNDIVEAKIIAKSLNEFNIERQKIEKDIFDEVKNQIIENQLYNNKVIFIIGKNWHEGVIGIVASKIKDKFEKPVIVLTETNNLYKGSCRSIETCDIGSIIIEAKIKGLLKDGGGHGMAGGIHLEKEKLNEVINFFNEKLEKNVDLYTKNKEKKIDLILECKSLSSKLIDEIDKLGPFGVDNFKPKILLKDVVVIQKDFIGKNKDNLKLVICDNSIHKLTNRITATFFKVNKDDIQINSIKYGSKINLLGEISETKFNDKVYIQFIIDDILFN